MPVITQDKTRHTLKNRKTWELGNKPYHQKLILPYDSVGLKKKKLVG